MTTQSQQSQHYLQERLPLKYGGERVDLHYQGTMVTRKFSKPGTYCLGCGVSCKERSHYHYILNDIKTSGIFSGVASVGLMRRVDKALGYLVLCVTCQAQSPHLVMEYLLENICHLQRVTEKAKK